MTDPTSGQLEKLLPLSRSAFHLLLALHEGPSHGYAIKQEVEALSQGVVRMGPGTLYTTIQRGRELGLIEESDSRPPPGEDHSQRRYYALTPLGRAALEAEVRRLGRVVDFARAVIATPPTRS
jgi:DNA-binding PadR family transcriptional regulator